MSKIIKRSVVVDGKHKTSISLEDEFWAELKRIAKDEEITVHGLVAQIDRDRPGNTGNLSSAIRLFILDDVMSRAGVRIES